MLDLAVFGWAENLSLLPAGQTTTSFLPPYLPLRFRCAPLRSREQLHSQVSLLLRMSCGATNQQIGPPFVAQKRNCDTQLPTLATSVSNTVRPRGSIGAAGGWRTSSARELEAREATVHVMLNDHGLAAKTVASAA